MLVNQANREKDGRYDIPSWCLRPGARILAQVGRLCHANFLSGTHNSSIDMFILDIFFQNYE